MKEEPFRLIEWQMPGSYPGSLYTCARPGRSRGTKGKVPDLLALEWAQGLPGVPKTCIISLLGQKPDGRSEFSFYSSFNDAEGFDAWLNANATDRKFHVISYPTVDCKKINPCILTAIAADVTRLVSQGETVVVMDSGGSSRSGAVIEQLGASCKVRFTATAILRH